MKKASSYYLVGTIFNKGIGFITVPIFTRILTMDDYGIVTTYNSWVAIISMFISLALYMAIRSSFVDYENKVNDFLSTVLLFTVGYGFCVSVIICAAIYLLPISINIGLVVLCLLQAIGSALIEDVSQFLMMRINYRFRTAVMVIPNLLSTLIAIVAIKYIVHHNQYLGRIVPSSLITFGTALLLLLIYLPKGKNRFNKEYLKYGLTISLPLVLHGIALNILAQSDRTMISAIKNTSETAIYGLIYNFSMIATVITTAFDGIWVPFFMRNMKKEKYDPINEYSVKYIELMTIAMIGVVLVGPEIVKLLSIEPYWEGITIIPPIVLANYLIFLYTLYVYIEHYYKKTVFISINTTIAAVVNILLNYLFIRNWGYIGAAYSTLISYALSLILHYIYSRRLNRSLFPMKQLLLPLLVLSMIVVVFYMCINLWPIRWFVGILSLLLMIIKERKFLKYVLNQKTSL